MTRGKENRDGSSTVNFVIIGSGRGLGRALVSELKLEDKKRVNIIAVGRMTSEEVVRRSKDMSSNQRVRYEEIDVRREDSVELFKKLSDSLPPGPINLIFNSAIIQCDKKDSELLDAAVARDIVEVGVVGFIRALEGFEDALLRHGGCFLGISSASALSYPIAGPLVTYPASKAFMDKMLQALAVVWPAHVRALVIHLGRVGSAQESTCGRFYYPTYSRTARHILKILKSSSRSRSYTYPLVHAVAFRVLHHVLSFSWPVKITKWLRGSNALNK